MNAFLQRWWSLRPTGTGVIVLSLLMVAARILELPLAVAIAAPILVFAALSAALAALELLNDQADERQQNGQDGPEPSHPGPGGERQ